MKAYPFVIQVAAVLHLHAIANASIIIYGRKLIGQLQSSIDHLDLVYDTEALRGMYLKDA